MFQFSPSSQRRHERRTNYRGTTFHRQSRPLSQRVSDCRDLKISHDHSPTTDVNKPSDQSDHLIA